MNALKTKCVTCGSENNRHISQNCVDGQLCWNIATICESCGEQLEQDGVGPLPAHERQQLLATQGIWQLHTPITSTSKIILLKVLREQLDTPMNALSQLKAQIENAPIAGTRAEMDCLAYYLMKQGITAKVVPFEDRSPA